MRTIVTFLLLVLPATAAAQYFAIETSPRTLSLVPGTSGEFVVTVRPSPGFTATVNLRAMLPTLGGAFLTEPGLLNAPYSTSARFSLSPYAAQVGRHPVIVEGWNGPVIERDTVWLVVEAVPGLRGWQWFSTLNSPLPDNGVTALAVEKNGIAWVGTDKGLARWQQGEWTIFRRGSDSVGLRVAAVRALAADSGGGVWILNGAEVIHFRDDRWTYYPPGTSGMPWNAGASPALSVAPDRTVYLASRDGLLRFDGTIWALMPNSPGSGRGIFIDPSGAIYVTTFGVLYRFDGTFWSQFSMESLGFEPSYLTDVAFEPDGTILGALEDAHSGAIIRFDPRISPISVETVRRSVNYNVVTGIARGDDATIWATTSPYSTSSGWGDTSGLMRLSAGTLQRYTVYNSGMPQAHATHVRLDGSGVVWMGTFSGGVARFDPRVASGVASSTERRIAAVTPNPADDRVELTLRLARPADLRLELVDLLGRTLRSWTRLAESGQNSITLGLDGITPGAYWLVVNHGAAVESHRLFVR